jgi:hypothetical protein
MIAYKDDDNIIEIGDDDDDNEKPIDNQILSNIDLIIQNLQ